MFGDGLDGLEVHPVGEHQLLVDCSVRVQDEKFFNFVFATYLHFGHSFFRLPQSLYLWSFNVAANMAIMAFMVKMAIMALPSMAINMTFMGVYRKNAQNVDHQ